MKSHHVKLIALSCLLALAACGKKRTRRAEIVECSSISLDAKGTTQCLVQLYHWKPAEAQQVAATRAIELDSLKRWQEDSVWALGAAKHKRDLQGCERGAEQLNNCLLVAGWPLRRVNSTTESVWSSESHRHRRELQTFFFKCYCNHPDLLSLPTRRSSDRALATADSVTRA